MIMMKNKSNTKDKIEMVTGKKKKKMMMILMKVGGGGGNVEEADAEADH